MTSAAKINANRRNAQRSTGPRSAAGKARTRSNALRHGLSVRPSYDPAAAAQIEEFAIEFCAGSVVAEQGDLALRAAEAEVDMARVRAAKVHLINNSASRLKEQQTFIEPTEWECTTVAFSRHSKTLVAFERYERRQFLRRNRALRKLANARAAEARARAAEAKARVAEQVAPPRPKQQYRPTDLFVEDVLPLRLADIMKVVIEPGVEGTRYSKTLKASLQHSIRDVKIFVEVEGSNGCIVCILRQMEKLLFNGSLLRDGQLKSVVALGSSSAQKPKRWCDLFMSSVTSSASVRIML
jgi:hypothetical protein